MITPREYPILEFDTDPIAKTDPSINPGWQFETEKLVITFFPEVMKKLTDDGDIELIRTINGENPVLIYRFKDAPDVMITHGQIGCPACAGNLDYFQAHGAKKVMFCGGGGVLDRNIKVGQLLVVESAIRDEGFSYHYVEPSRYIYADENVLKKITAYLDEHDADYLRGRVWTIDAMFRETKERIEMRKAEGAQIVEMEQAGCLAVAQSKGIEYGAIIYGGDDVSQDEWDQRGWMSRNGIRYDLVRLCEKIVGTF